MNQDTVLALIAIGALVMVLVAAMWVLRLILPGQRDRSLGAAFVALGKGYLVGALLFAAFMSLVFPPLSAALAYAAWRVLFPRRKERRCEACGCHPFHAHPA